ncbi:hypothetical protein KZC46_22635, partial [Salmonella enterica subsp. enterica serovar Javiana]|nr:hypothetical protein [Salmonella enterica subsp. enterica serovar Javiana]
LGNGTATPLGTPEFRDAALQSRAQLFVFPYCVAWGDGNSASLRTGIVARSSYRLVILRQLPRVLSAYAIPLALTKAESPTQLLTLLTGSTTNTPCIFYSSDAADELTPNFLSPHLRYYHQLLNFSNPVAMM